MGIASTRHQVRRADSAAGGLRSRGPAAAICLLILAAAGMLALQYMQGAYTASIGGYPDEPAHVVTSLMYRQFLLAPTADPLEFAKNYYSHYPYLAAGHWPPMLHLSAAIWTIFVGAGKTQFILYLGLCGLTAAALLYRSILTFGSVGLAAAFVGIWMMLGESQLAFSLFMTEGPLTCLTLAAVVAYTSYLRTPSYRGALLFAALSSAAILTKETAVALAFIPPLAVAVSQQWKLLRRGDFWLPAPLVVALVAPWHLWVADLGVGRFRNGVVQRLLLDDADTAQERLTKVVVLVGWPLLLLAAVGLAACLVRAHQKRDSSTDWIAHAALIAGGLVVLIAAPESKEVRHIYHLSPSLLLFAAAGAWTLTQRLESSMRTPAVVFGAVCCVLLSPATFSRQAKILSAPPDAMIVAQYLHSRSDAQTVLISAADHASEGPVIAEMALLEPSPTRFLIRASKTIYLTDWSAMFYRPLLTTQPDVENFIDSSGVDAIVRVSGPGAGTQRPDEKTLSLVIASRADDWAPASSDLLNTARVYRRITANGAARQPIRLQMSTRLGHDLIIGSKAAPAPRKPPG